MWKIMARCSRLRDRVLSIITVTVRNVTGMTSTYMWVEFSSSLFKKNDKIGGPPPRERELLNLLFSYFPSFDFITVNFFFSKKARSDFFFFSRQNPRKISRWSICSKISACDFLCCLFNWFSELRKLFLKRLKTEYRSWFEVSARFF